ncbi:hypothetical protein, partial [Desulfobacula sp.]|uniref:hypothetical protein n=1 Tax=Desulfobacula sp. TaxID=2593537 RepID=UPI0039B98BAB
YYWSYKNHKKQKEYATFITSLESWEWISGWLDVLDITGVTHAKHNRIKKAIIYQKISLVVSTILFQADKIDHTTLWTENFINAQSNLAISYNDTQRMLRYK